VSRKFEYTVDLADWQEATRTITVRLLNGTPIDVVMPEGSYSGAQPSIEAISVIAPPIVERHRPYHKDPAVQVRLSAYESNMIFIPEEI